MIEVSAIPTKAPSKGSRTMTVSSVTSFLFLVLGGCAEGPDVPPPTFSHATQNEYRDYLSGRLGPPMVFIVSEDGLRSYWMYCPQYADRCIDASQSGGTIAKGIAWCEKNANTPCHVYARGNRVVWK